MIATGLKALVWLMSVGLLGITGSMSEAQSKADLSAKYPRIDTYQVRPGIMMLVEFDDTGQACKMTLGKAGVFSGQDSQETLSNHLVDELVDELAPAKMRGKASPYFDPNSYVAGGTFLLKQNFENVSVEKIGNGSDSAKDGVRFVRIYWTKRVCSSVQQSSMGVPK